MVSLRKLFSRKKEITDLGDNTVKDIRRIAKKHGWVEEKQTNPHTLRFAREFNELIDVFYTKMTVGTLVHHPKHGRKMLFRKNVDKEMLERIFKNPRVHTHRGYFEK